MIDKAFITCLCLFTAICHAASQPQGYGVVVHALMYTVCASYCR